MLTIKTNPAELLRTYTWEMLRENGVLKLINGLVPVAPIEDVPELRNSEHPYIIYGYSESDQAGYEIIEGSYAMRIIARNTNELKHISNIVAEAFRGGDETARSVNAWTDSYTKKYNDSLEDGLDLEGIRFTWIHTVLVESPDPSETEGGEVEGSIMVNYRYVSGDSRKPKTFQTDGTWK